MKIACLFHILDSFDMRISVTSCIVMHMLRTIVAATVGGRSLLHLPYMSHAQPEFHTIQLRRTRLSYSVILDLYLQYCGTGIAS